MPKNTTKVITIDGPSASGKTSVSRSLAANLGWGWVSTGAFYRAIALIVKRNQIDLLDEPKLVDLITINQQKNWDVVMQPEKTAVYLNGEDVSDKAFSANLSDLASQISALPKVREVLLQPQRDCLKKAHKGLIAEGRDCGTVVFPDAQLKVYLTASQIIRGKRRALEEDLEDKDVLSHHIKRDSRDMQRSIAPLKVAKDALVIDTTQMDIDATVHLILERAKASLLFH